MHRNKRNDDRLTLAPLPGAQVIVFSFGRHEGVVIGQVADKFNWYNIKLDVTGTIAQYHRNTFILKKR